MANCSPGDHNGTGGTRKTRLANAVGKESVYYVIGIYITSFIIAHG
jgi:hypothetical protein